MKAGFDARAKARREKEKEREEKEREEQKEVDEREEDLGGWARKMREEQEVLGLLPRRIRLTHPYSRH